MSSAALSLAALAQRLTQQLQGLRRRGSMNYTINFTELTALLELVEALAPEFEAAFREENVATLQARGGRRVDPRVAIRALEAALVHEPDAWFLRVMLAYYLIAELGDERTAGNELLRAAEHPDAPFYVRGLARRLRPDAAEAGAGPTGELRLFHQIAQLQARVDAFTRARGRGPRDLAEAADDPEARALLARVEVDLVVSDEGKVVTRESQVRDRLARDRAHRFEHVRPYRLPEY